MQIKNETHNKPPTIMEVLDAVIKDEDGIDHKDAFTYSGVLRQLSHNVDKGRAFSLSYVSDKADYTSTFSVIGSSLFGGVAFFDKNCNPLTEEEFVNPKLSGYYDIELWEYFFETVKEFDLEIEPPTVMEVLGDVVNSDGLFDYDSVLRQLVRSAENNVAFSLFYRVDAVGEPCWGKTLKVAHFDKNFTPLTKDEFLKALADDI